MPEACTVRMFCMLCVLLYKLTHIFDVLVCVQNLFQYEKKTLENKAYKKKTTKIKNQSTSILRTLILFAIGCSSAYKKKTRTNWMFVHIFALQAKTENWDNLFKYGLNEGGGKWDQSKLKENLEIKVIFILSPNPRIHLVYNIEKWKLFVDMNNC